LDVPQFVSLRGGQTTSPHLTKCSKPDFVSNSFLGFRLGPLDVAEQQALQLLPANRVLNVSGKVAVRLVQVGGDGLLWCVVALFTADLQKLLYALGSDKALPGIFWRHGHVENTSFCFLGFRPWAVGWSSYQYNRR